MSDPQKQILLAVIPDDLTFADLELSREHGHMRFRWEPIEQICRENHLDIDLFKHGPEDNISSLITAWYFKHRENGGTPNATMEEYIEEIKSEDAAHWN